MKFFFTLTIPLLFSVAFLYYLLNSTIFLPIDSFGNYNWLNIGVFLILSFFIVFFFLALFMFSVFLLIKKKEERKLLMLQSLKFSFIATFGLLIVLVLNFFGILNILWGILLLVVVLIFLFII